MWDVLKDGLIDSLKIFPFILIIYILMEVIESAKNKEKIEKALSGKGAPFIAGITGIVPECGFPVMCAKLYDNGLIRVGTLITAFLASSDEGLVVLITGGAEALVIIKFVVIKLIYAIAVGVVINLFAKRLDVKHVCSQNNSCVECGTHHGGKWDRYLVHPLLHALSTFVFVLIFAELIAVLYYFVGTDRVANFLSNSKYLQPLLCSIVGLIPNCASSIILSQGYVDGIVSFAGLIAGLSTNAGLGVIVLFKKGQNVGKSAFIMAMLLGFGILLGYIALLLTSLGF